MERRIVVCSQHKRIGNTYPTMKTDGSIENVALDNSWTIVWTCCHECFERLRRDKPTKTGKFDEMLKSEEAWK